MNKELIILSLIGSIALFAVVNAATVGTAGVSTISAAGANILTCQQGYYLIGGTDTTGNSCSPCSAGLTTSAATTLSACTGCTAGSYCISGSATGTTTDVAPVTCQAGFYCAASTAGLDGMTPCGDGQYSVAGASAVAGCLSITGSAFTGCSVYVDALASKCIVPKAGYITIARDSVGLAAAAVTPCVTGCNACTGSTASTCTAATKGYYINDFDATAKTVVACSTDGLCGECTFAKGSTATNGVINCTKAKSGAYLDATVATAKVAQACAAGKGSVEDNTGDATSCTACDAVAKFCGNCKATTFCTTCTPGYVLTAATGVCAAYSGSVHASCAKANADTDASCQACDAAKNRELEDDATSTTTPKAKVATGKCICKAGFGDQSTLSTPNWTCGECGLNVATCTFGATGKTVLTCNAGFLKAGMECKAKDATDVAGFFYNTATSAFAACHASCAKCTGTLVNNCSACPDAPTGWVEPTSAASNFATYIKGARALINATCYADCPTGFIANTAQSNCVAGAASSPSSSGILAIFSLIATLFLVF